MNSSLIDDRDGILELTNRTMTVALLLTKPKLWRLDPRLDQRTAKAKLHELDYDLAPLDEEPLRRYVAREWLHGDDPVGDAARPIDSTVIVSTDVPLVDVVDRFDRTDIAAQWFFVLGRRGVENVVTAADLASLPVSILVLGWLVALDNVLGELLARSELGPWSQDLHDNEVAKVKAHFDNLVERNLARSPLDLLSFEQRLRKAGRVREFQHHAGATDRGSFRKWAQHIIGLRNDLAHGRSMLDRLEPAEAARQFRSIRALLACATALRDEANPLGIEDGEFTRCASPRSPG